MPKTTTKAKKAAASKLYVLTLKFNETERALLEAVEKRRGIPRSTLLKSYLREDGNRLGIP